MAKITMSEAQDFTVPPADTVLKLTVDSIKIVDKTSERGDWQAIEFKFNVNEAPGEYAEALRNTPIWGSVAFKLTEHPDNKLKQWAEALLGIELSEGFELDTDMFLGRQVRGVVSHYNKKNGGTGYQIGALLPLRAGGAPATVGASAPAAPASTPAASGGWSSEPPF